MVFVAVYIIVALVMPPILRRVISIPGSSQRAGEKRRQGTISTLVLVGVGADGIGLRDPEESPDGLMTCDLTSAWECSWSDVTTASPQPRLTANPDPGHATGGNDAHLSAYHASFAAVTARNRESNGRIDAR
jgi:hypothetical protein